MDSAIYIGDRDDLAGRVATLRPSIIGGVMARFADQDLSHDLTEGWTQFSPEEFMTEE